MADLIDRGALYKEVEAWEAAAMKAVKKATDVEERKRWGHVLQERTAFKYDVADAPSVDAVPVVRCKDCRWGREACGNIECFVDSNIPSEYHGYEWFCPNGERRDDEAD